MSRVGGVPVLVTAVAPARLRGFKMFNVDLQCFMKVCSEVYARDAVQVHIAAVHSCQCLHAGLIR